MNYRKKIFMGVKKKYLTPEMIWDNITQVSKMNEILEQSLLYDFYGELLTKHQKEIYEQFVLEDLSLGEIAREAGISRQGVHDMIKRCNQSLHGYEEKLHLVEKFMNIKSKVNELEEILEGYQENDSSQMISKMKEISREILEEL